ncbi:MAG: O-antigen polymerase [Verrucomicrobiota bacterium]
MIAVAAFAAIMLRRSGGNYLLSIFQFLFAFAVLYGYGLYNAREGITFHYGEAVLPSCWLAVSLGFLGIVLGYTRAVNATPPGWRHLLSATNPDRLGTVGLVLAVIGVAGEIRFIQLSGGVEDYFSAARGAGDYEHVSAYVYGARWLLFPGVAFLLAAGMKKKAWHGPGIVLLAVMAAYNLLLGQRSGIFAVAILGLYCAMLWRRKIPNLITVAAVGCVLAVLLGFVKLTRDDYHLGSDFKRSKELLQSLDAGAVLELATANFAVIKDKEDPSHMSEIVLFAGFIKTIPSEVDYDYFVFYTAFLYKWIPRVWWPDRPDPSKEKVVELDRLLGKTHRTGSTPTILGMYYLHLGYLSVFFMAALTGYYLGVIDSFGRRAMTHPAAAVVFVTLSNGVLSMPMGLGPLASMSSLLPFSIVPMLAGLWWAAEPHVGRTLQAGSRSARRGVLRRRPGDGTVTSPMDSTSSGSVGRSAPEGRGSLRRSGSPTD